MTTTTPNTTFRAFLSEPLTFAISQPGQILISSASVAIVAAEAATLVPVPFNLALAIGAEWVYLRGLISGSGIKTRWAAALNWSAVLLVVCYGALWGFRGFHLIPEAPPVWAAVVLTIIHIGMIGAVTICSAMVHRAGADLQAADQRKRELTEEERQRKIQAERDTLAIEMERKKAELAIWEQGMEAKARLRQRSRGAAANTPSAASGTGTNSSREQLREQVRRTLAEHPNPNKSELARRLGIGRTLLYELLAEIEGEATP
jgi:hypothetical protein